MLGGYLNRLVWIGLPYVRGRLVRVYVVLGLDKHVYHVSGIRSHQAV